MKTNYIIADVCISLSGRHRGLILTTADQLHHFDNKALKSTPRPFKEHEGRRIEMYFDNVKYS